MKYEIEPVYWEDHHHESIISTLTGLELDDIIKVTAKIRDGDWRGSIFINVFQKLGFNTNSRFIPFDIDTEYPCLLRCADKGCWYAFPFDGTMFYDGPYGYNLGNNSKNIKGKHFITVYEQPLKITSMLQVWI